MYSFCSHQNLYVKMVGSTEIGVWWHLQIRGISTFEFDASLPNKQRNHNGAGVTTNENSLMLKLDTGNYRSNNLREKERETNERVLSSDLFLSKELKYLPSWMRWPLYKETYLIPCRVRILWEEGTYTVYL